MKRHIDDSDDGRVIAPMNIEGMPWYAPKQEQPRDNPADGSLSSASIPEKLTPRESLAFTFGVLKAVLLVAGVFIGVFFLFILFCVYVWF